MPKANIPRLTGLSIQPDPSLPNHPHGLYAPALPTATIAKLIPETTPGGELRNGAIIYDTTTNTYKGYQSVNGANTFVNFNTGAVTAATGIGLILGSPLVLPQGTRLAVEVPANAIVGFTYYDTTGQVIRHYTQNFAATGFFWETLHASVSGDATVGAGLSGSPLVLPQGTRGTVEVAGNQVNGFTYYDTTSSMIRIYTRNYDGGTDEWQAVFANLVDVHGQAPAGVGLTAGSPFRLPIGTRAAVELPANATLGFMYYDQTNNVIRVYVNNAWTTNA